MSQLETMFLEGLSKMYYAEQRILAALPKMRAAARSPELRDGFEKHEAETADQIERLEQVFVLLGTGAQAKECPAIDGLLMAGDRMMATLQGTPGIDAALVAAGQGVEHYEMANYGTLVAWANCLGMEEAANLLDVSLDEEIATDVALTEVADGGVNERALAA